MKVIEIMNTNPKYFQIDTDLNIVIEYFLHSGKKAVIVTDEDKTVGIIDSFLLLSSIYKEGRLPEMKDIVIRKINTFHENDNILDLLEVKQEIIPIVDERNKLVGQVTDNDISDYLKCELSKANQQNKMLTAIFDNSYDGLYITDGKGYTIDVNKAYTKITGIKKKDLIGYHMNDLIKKGYFLDSVSLKIIKSKKPMTMTDSFENGKKCLISGQPICNDEGEIIRIVTNVRDMTGLIELQEKIEKSEKLNQKYENEVKYLRQKNFDDISIKGKSKELLIVKERIARVAEVDATVLITGETGVGKELVAKELHQHSHRKQGPFVKINCAAIPENLLETELFGYEKGAFTGADNKRKIGLFELAQKGSILLDEIGELPFHVQAKLLRVLQEKEIIRVGGTEKIKIDVRIIASTNRELLELTKDNHFREDLYYRLNVLPINVPPLRERRSDISLLSKYFINEYNLKYNKNKKINEDGYSLLNSYRWPGNIREMKNLIEQLVILVDEDIITEKHIRIFLNIDNEKDDYIYNIGKYKLNEALEILEKHYIKENLVKYKSTRKAAKNLGISQPSVVRKCKKYKLIFDTKSNHSDTKVNQCNA